jgi:hypothetical protein
MATDRDKAMNLIRGAFQPMLDHSPALGLLREILGKNQNAPPLGEADGSLNEEEWKALQRVCDGLASAKTAATSFMDLCARRPGPPAPTPTPPLAPQPKRSG